MRLIKFLSAVLSAIVSRMWSTRITEKELAVDKLLNTAEGRKKLASANNPGLDVGKIKVGDKVVFANPKAGLDCDIASAIAARLRVGQEYTVTKVDLGSWRCNLWLEGWSCDFNSVQFNSLPTEKDELTVHQTVVKAEVDKFLDADKCGARIIHGPRQSGKTRIAHEIHHERGGVVVVRSDNAAKHFRWDHMRMYGEGANVMAASQMIQKMRGFSVQGFSAGVVVLDIDRKQYHAIRPVAIADNNRVVYLHECDKVRGSLWTTSREHGGRDIVCANDLHDCDAQ